MDDYHNMTRAPRPNATWHHEQTYRTPPPACLKTLHLRVVDLALNPNCGFTNMYSRSIGTIRSLFLRVVFIYIYRLGDNTSNLGSGSWDFFLPRWFFLEVLTWCPDEFRLNTSSKYPPPFPNWRSICWLEYVWLLNMTPSLWSLWYPKFPETCQRILQRTLAETCSPLEMLGFIGQLHKEARPLATPQKVKQI